MTDNRTIYHAQVAHTTLQLHARQPVSYAAIVQYPNAGMPYRLQLSHHDAGQLTVQVLAGETIVLDYTLPLNCDCGTCNGQRPHTT